MSSSKSLQLLVPQLPIDVAFGYLFSAWLSGCLVPLSRSCHPTPSCDPQVLPHEHGWCQDVVQKPAVNAAWSWLQIVQRNARHQLGQMFIALLPTGTAVNGLGKEQLLLLWSLPSSLHRYPTFPTSPSLLFGPFTAPFRTRETL